MFILWSFLALCVLGQDAPLLAERSEDVGNIEARQQPGVVASANFLRRAYHGSVVAGNYVYIDGGAFSYNLGGTPQYLYSTTTLSIDLTKSWTNASVTINSNSKPSDAPNLDCGSLWYDATNNSLYAGFAGAAPRFNTPNPYQLGLWQYALDNQGGGTWSSIQSATAAIKKTLTRPYQALTAWGDDGAFTIGGYVSDLTSPATSNYSYQLPIPGNIHYNFTNGNFYNSSSTGYNFNGTAERGVLHYVPSFGPKGVYVLLGGDSGVGDHYDAGKSLQTFQKLTIYDPATNNFYNQTATGNIPRGRIEFCATGINSTNGTYEIFIYAGWGGNLGSMAIPYDEIYILTLPAFVWIKVNYAPANPRHGHSCHTVGNRQMLVIGGVDSLRDTVNEAAPTLDKSTFATADQFTQGLAIFDMSTLSWSNSYNANAPAYVQPSLVQSYYAARSTNGPDKWNSNDLQSLFKTTHFTTSTITSPPNSTGTDTPASPSPSSSPSQTGAIAGGVVGGVLGLALLAGLVFFLFRRHQKKNNIATSSPAAGAELGNGNENGNGNNQMSFAGKPVTNYKYQPVGGAAPTYAGPTLSEVHADTMPQQLATGADHEVGEKYARQGQGGRHFVSELEAREHVELP